MCYLHQLCYICICLPIKANGKELHYMPPLSELLPQINSVFFSSTCFEMKWRPILDFSHLVHTAQVNPRPETYGPHGKFPPHVHFSQSAKKESFRNILITIDLEKSERRHVCSLSTPRSRRWSYHDGELNYYCNSFACFQLQRYAICIGNSMICSDISHKYHKWYFEIVIRNFTSTSGIYTKYHVQIMLLFVYTTTPVSYTHLTLPTNREV